jgi:PhnB protein
MLQPDSRTETENLFNALSAGGKVTQPLQDKFWGDYYGSFTDKYGVQWMFNCNEKK